MKINKLEALLPYFQCPTCHGEQIVVAGDSLNLECRDCGIQYPISFDRPVMLRTDNDVFSLDEYLDTKTPDLGADRYSIWRSLIPKASVNLSRDRVLSTLGKLLMPIPNPTVLVVGSGNQRQWLDKRLGITGSLDIIYTDIDVGSDVDIFCDGHDLPFVDGSIDAVITTAVLEHVLYPERVAAEISRILKVGGLLYSELPFMQQVHEGAYDFTRYTMSGHRRLFNRFAEIESGMVAGPGTTLVWAIENFILAFMMRSRLRKLSKFIIRLFFGWIKYFYLLLENSPAVMDGASCTYLLGRKMVGHVTDAEIISRYNGAQRLRHT